MIAGGTLWGTKIALLISILKVKLFTLIDMCLWILTVEGVPPPFCQMGLLYFYTITNLHERIGIIWFITLYRPGTNELR